MVKKLYQYDKKRFIFDRDDSGAIMEFPVLGNNSELYGCGFAKIDSQWQCNCGVKNLSADQLMDHLRSSSAIQAHHPVDGGNWLKEPHLFRCT